MLTDVPMVELTESRTAVKMVVRMAVMMAVMSGMANI